MRDVFERVLPNVLSGYEARPGQVAMAQAVLNALRDEIPLLVEAGTGTGKTLAYLLPAALSGRKVVVSTATKALEEQLIEKDVPIVRAVLLALGRHVSFAVMKGLPNYLCRRRYQELRLDGGRGVEDAELSQLHVWVEQTRLGDLSELRGHTEDSPLVRLVRSSAETRIGASCSYYDECFVTTMRRQAEDADVVIVNHHLFFADLALRTGRSEGHASVIPPYDAVIFDEAHQVEDTAAEFFGTRVSSAGLDSLVAEAERVLAARAVSDARIGSMLGALREASRALFSALRPFSGVAEESRKLFAPSELTDVQLKPYYALDARLEGLLSFVHDSSPTSALIARRAREFRDALAAILNDPNSRCVCWVDARERSVSVTSYPLDLRGLLEQRLFARTKAVVATSATLATVHRDGSIDFQFTRSRLGAPTETRELVVPSPFDFSRQAGLYIANDLPEPLSPEFEARALERAVELIQVTDGGAFLLTTSTRAMRAFGQALRARLANPVYVQGELSKLEILERFRREKNAVLSATLTFWEGVDVPGSALRLVILDKIPFAVPTDPVTVARSRVIESEGGNPFAEYIMPAAAVTLKQGFGRLVRGARDFGIVALLDPRVVKKPYGRRLLRALPPAARLQSLDEVRTFWAEVLGHDAGCSGRADVVFPPAP